MVLLLDLEHENDDEDDLRTPLEETERGCLDVDNQQPRELIVCPTDGNIVLDQNADLIAAVLACFPVSRSLAAHLDLNDLHALSSTSHAVHNAIIQFAHHLRRESLRCVNDEPPPLPERFDRNISTPSDSMKQLDLPQSSIQSGEEELILDAFSSLGTYSFGRYPSSIGLSGKVSRCARDLVAPCRRCGVVICRNCAIKPPPTRSFNERFRRLCKTCLEAPVEDHLQQFQAHGDHSESPPASSASSAYSSRSLSTGSAQSLACLDRSDGEASSTGAAFLRSPCECESHGVYLCQPCGQSLCSANTTYKRVWTWRSRYSTHIGGGLGTGLGQGEQGQKCGRGEHCLETGAAGICWVEIDCSETRAQMLGPTDPVSVGRSGMSLLANQDIRPMRNKPGYLSQEIEGIGGVVKKKVKKRIKVGATVYEFDDERESGRYLSREASGQERSWCGWCFRVCPGAGDHDNVRTLLHT